jgi:hypothetical protein
VLVPPSLKVDRVPLVPVNHWTQPSGAEDGLKIKYFTFFQKATRVVGEHTRDFFILFIFSFHQFTAEPQRLPT